MSSTITSTMRQPSERAEPIAIVGSACRFPGSASSPSKLWALLSNPRDLGFEIPSDRFGKGFYHPNGIHHGTTNVQHAYLLEEDIRVFDAAFFNIHSKEANSIDPQQRLLLETVYEAMESGGHTIEGLKGSDTAVYTGTMSVDWMDQSVRDLDTIPQYLATGSNRAIISNRVSYVFDWRGPSMTIDTACSSSLIAVHQGVTALRGGESRVAVACGTQVILNPEQFIAESKLQMLSPTGRSRMWDKDADGYARGEGTAAIIMKRLSDAIADGDHIESIIRETGTNQDGRTPGLTMPSSEAQSALIDSTYKRAGLDPVNNPRDRPQYFEAHGTGTQAGDPREAGAIYEAFGRHIPPSETPLYVGSIKTVIGHLEGTAGLAGLLKASASIQNGYITPNLLFKTLNPKLKPFYKSLKVPTKLTPWPEVPEGVPRRVSVNSFGFGGSNAHAILEQYSRPPDTETSTSADVTNFTPFVFSAVSEGSLVAQLRAYSDHLKIHSNIDPCDLAWTLQARRSHFPLKIAFSALTIKQLVTKLDEKLETLKAKPGTTLGVRANSRQTTASPRILGVFTGQGAQWASMGADLIRSSEFVRQRILDLENSLASLPAADRPEWSLTEQILAGKETSRLSEAAFSQPLCTAIQVALVDLLRTAGIKFTTVVGHSSGEISAAYAADFLSGEDAIRVAYYRGLYTSLADGGSGQKGAMLAVGTSWEDAHELINLRTFKGRLAVAAHNSPASVTLSGDADAIVHAKKIFDEEKKFARLLQVDQAYHSHHMLPCGDKYVGALRACGVRVKKDRNTSCVWYSSVSGSDEPVAPVEEIQDEYWRDNMTKSVLFAEAVRNALASDDQINLGLEVGPHPALKGPVAQNVGDDRSTPLSYSGVLARGKNDVESFADALGFVWAQLGAAGVDIQSYAKAAAAGSKSVRPRLVTGLPLYQWNHDKSYWAESRRSRRIRARSEPNHEILGSLSPDSTPQDMRWSNILRVSEMPWLAGHQIQGQMIFPAAGYIAMALESSKILAAEKSVKTYELYDLSIPRATVIEDADNASIETLVTLTKIQFHRDDTATADFRCYALPVTVTGSKQEMTTNATGTVKIVFGEPDVDALSSTPVEDFNLRAVDSDEFYEYLVTLGYGYTGPFRALSSTQRRLGHSSGLIDTYDYAESEPSRYLIHPSTLDVAFQASILAYTSPSDERLWALHVPTVIGTIRVNAATCASPLPAGSRIPVHSILEDSEAFSGFIELMSEDGQHTMVQVEDLVIKPLAPAAESDDRVMFTYTKFASAIPDGGLASDGRRPSSYETDLSMVCERLCYFYISKWAAELSDKEWENGPPHFLHLRNWLKHVRLNVSKGKNPHIKREWTKDTPEFIEKLIGPYRDDGNVKIILAVGENLPAAVRGETTILEHMIKDDMLEQHYKKSLGAEVANEFLANMMKQIIHRYPHAKILEIGAGTGGATKAVLETIQGAMSSYTYTDLSVGFFGLAEKLFEAYSDKMEFKTFDVEKAPKAQGFEPNSYDIVIASNCLHATASLEKTLKHTRALLKPGGYLLILELTMPLEIIRTNTIFGVLPGWWLGVNDGRKLSPTISRGAWHSQLRKTGFSGIDTINIDVSPITWPASVVVSQAVDDRVQFLRRPLSAPSSAPSVPIYIESLVILGNGSLELARVAEELQEHLQPFCGELVILDSLPTEEEASNLIPMSTFINLADLDSPIFEDITEDSMESVKRMTELAKNILWVTQGALVDEPYHMASIAFCRALRTEAPHVSLNNLDISDIKQDNISKLIAEHLLQLYALDEWEHEPQPLLWSKEREAFIEDGKIMIPRMVSDSNRNARLNSGRRKVTKSVIEPSDKVSFSAPSDVSPASLVNQPALVEQTSPIKVETSSAMALQIIPGTSLFVAIGRANDSADGPTVLLSTENTNEQSPVAKTTVPNASNLAYSLEELLILVASELLAANLAEKLSLGDHLLLHCSKEDRLLIAALCRCISDPRIRLSITYDSAEAIGDSLGPAVLKVNDNTPRHFLRKTLRNAKPSHYLDLTARPSFDQYGAHLGLRIGQDLPASCKRIDLSDLLQTRSSLHPSYHQDILVDRLNNAVIRATTISTAPEEFQNLVIHLSRVEEPSTQYHATSAIHWPSDRLVKTNVRALDVSGFFSRTKTYVLVGLSGSIGQSLCEWMASNGAGCVVLTSRRPNVDQRWIESFQGSGTTVKVLPMDVTNIDSVESAVKTIRESCPPIAGVAHGAMVLHDALFASMSADKIQQIIGPKIDGAINLENAFSEDALDFFVMFSSVSMVCGNAGQSLYAAGCGYLNGLARKRRRCGLAGSTFDIGRVAGLGYVESADQVVRDQLIGLGLKPISEADLRNAFAETIWAGFPQPQDKDTLPEAVVTMGVRHFCEDEDVKGPWFTNPLFSHCIIKKPKNQSSSGDQRKENSLPLSQQLTQVASKKEALDVIIDSFSDKLGVMLQLGEQATDRDAPLNELGIDSLVAVEVRAWFLKNLKVDIPVLKIIGGASITELCEKALELLPPTALAGLDQPKAEARAPEPAPKLEFKIPLPLTDEDSQSSENASQAISRAGSPNSKNGSTPQSSLGSEVGDDGAPVADPPKTNENAGVLPPIRRPKKILKSVPISLAQSRYWFLQHLLDDQSTHNVATYYRIEGDLRVNDLKRAIRLVCARHESLRTCFVADQAERANQEVMPSSPLQLECKTIQSEDEVETEYARIKTFELDMESGDLLKLVLLTLSPSVHFLLMNYHHIIMDGISWQVFLADLEKAYNGQHFGSPPRQYPEFSVAQRQALESGAMNEQLNYWRQIFPTSDPPSVLPLLPMARVSARTSLKVYDTHQVVFRLEPSLLARVKSFSKASGSSPFHLYLAAFKSMLFSFVDAPDLTIGVADAGRSEPNLRGSIGFFLNLLPLRFRRQDNQNFTDAMAEARNVHYAALENSRVPFDILLAELNVARSSLYSPFFQAFLDYRQGFPTKHAFGNTEFEIKTVDHGQSAYDITLDVTDSAADTVVMIRAQKSLYDMTAAVLLSETFTHFLETLTSDPSAPLKDTPLYSDKQRTQAIPVGRGPQMFSDWPATLPHRIDQVARENGDKVALTDGFGNELSYNDMTNRIATIAEALESKGVGSGSRVPVFQQAASDWVCSMLAIMRVGAIYVPLDLRNPLPRLAAVVKDCGPAAILVDATTLHDVPQLAVDGAHVIEVTTVDSKPSVHIANRANGASPAAILYTSGSTGTPKGIVVTHSGLRNEIEGYTKMWKLGAERTLQQSAFTFNHSSDQIYTGLANGGSVYIVPWSARGNPLEITRIMHEQSITYTKATPSEYLLWMQYGGDALRLASKWRSAFGGGESLTTTVTQEFSKLDLPNLRFYNSYGPTEISISSHKMEIAYREKQGLESMGRIPCGYSLPNYDTYIVDEELRPVPIGSPGEICLGGAGVSLGYFNNRELTDKLFIPNPFATPEDITNGWTRMYRTGDIGHLRDDGAMVFHSRIAGDSQVKIRGLRIELSDIESNIVRAAGGALNEAVVTLREGEPEFLVAHVVFAPSHGVADTTAFLERLLSNLEVPQYMVPVAAIPLDKFPLSNHSKVDRKAIKALPLPKRSQAAQQDVELTETMLQLRGVWREVLGQVSENLGFEIGPSTSFFLVGGNSLLIIRLQSQIRIMFNVALRLYDLLSANTLGEMAHKIDESASVAPIDWDVETAPPAIPSFLDKVSKTRGLTKEKKTGKTVVVTGGTGFLAKYVIPQLVARPDVQIIHCVAVRDPAKLNHASHKIRCHAGDLAAPLLGLSTGDFVDLASQVDVILHMGASRSFWDNYNVLRPSNVHPTKELIKLAATGKIPIHFISTAAVFGDNSSIDNVSAADSMPALDGTNGYTATKWASERILERSSVTLGVPSSIYRFAPAAANEPASTELLNQFAHYVDVTKAMPDATGWAGSMDMIPATKVANWLSESIMANVADCGANFTHYQGQVRVSVDELIPHLEGQMGGRNDLTRVPLLKWTGVIKRAGFEYCMMSHVASIEKETKLEMRR
ncbi:putative hybrid NRPS/PKS enzyme [Xylariaceae sp. FL1651]|nr:putative hybrid NRPS/PKS enzyme [Xylariaceae sp. FL1651]